MRIYYKYAKILPKSLNLNKNKKVFLLLNIKNNYKLIDLKVFLVLKKLLIKMLLSKALHLDSFNWDFLMK